MTSLAPLLQTFFTDRLMTQRQASPNTIAAYLDTFKLLLGYATTQTGKTPSQLEISDLGADTVTGFLTYLETVRGNSVRTRNARLAAIHSLFSYAALRHPEQAAVIQRVLAIPTARIQRNIVTTSMSEKPTRSWMLATRAPGPDGATMRCSSCRSRPGCASAS